MLIGSGAVAGALCMMIDPGGQIMGIDALLPHFQKLPFADVLFQKFLFSKFALFIVKDISNLTTAGFYYQIRKSGLKPTVFSA